MRKREDGEAMINTGITAVGGYVPEYVLTNKELEGILDTNEDWILTRTGIKERRILKGVNRGTSVMAAKALEDLCENRCIKPVEIEAVICATSTPDMLFPCTSNLVCHMLGAKNALSFDMLAACSGFLYALETGANFIRSGRYSKVVVIGADKMSCRLNYNDRNTSIIFGDGAGAVLLEPIIEDFGVKDAVLKTDGSGAELLNLKMGGSAYSFSQESLERGEQYFYQNGKQVFKHAVFSMISSTKEILQRNELKPSDIDYFVPHQANKRIIEAVAKELQVPIEKVVINLDRYGNTAAATIPLCLWEMKERFIKGDKIILTAFGGGFTWGSIYIEWTA